MIFKKNKSTIHWTIYYTVLISAISMVTVFLNSYGDSTNLWNEKYFA